MTLQPKRDLSAHRGDALPPRLMTESLINSPNTGDSGQLIQFPLKFSKTQTFLLFKVQNIFLILLGSLTKKNEL